MSSRTINSHVFSSQNGEAENSRHARPGYAMIEAIWGKPHAGMVALVAEVSLNGPSPRKRSAANMEIVRLRPLALPKRRQTHLATDGVHGTWRVTSLSGERGGFEPRGPPACMKSSTAAGPK